MTGSQVTWSWLQEIVHLSYALCKTNNEHARCRCTSRGKTLHQHTCAHESVQKTASGSIFSPETGKFWQVCMVEKNPLCCTSSLPLRMSHTDWIILPLRNNLPLSLPAITGYFFSIWLFKSNFRNLLMFEILLKMHYHFKKIMLGGLNLKKKIQHISTGRSTRLV